MATVYRENRKTPTRQYIATAAFNSYFFTYTLTTDPNTFVQTGSFSAVTADASKTPKGRILRETGERLFPGQSGVNTLMVKVFDPYSFLSGYIDPNAEVFAVYSTDKNGWVEDAYENNAASGTRHKGPSMYTAGDIIADNGNLAIRGTGDVSGNFSVGVGVTGGSTTTLNGAVTTTSRFRSSTATVVGATPDLSTSTGSFFQVTFAGAVTFAPTGIPAAGTFVYVFFTNTSGGGLTVTQGGNVVAGTLTVGATSTLPVIFVSNGSKIIEMSRGSTYASATVLP